MKRRITGREAGGKANLDSLRAQPQLTIARAEAAAPPDKSHANGGAGGGDSGGAIREIADALSVIVDKTVTKERIALWELGALRKEIGTFRDLMAEAIRHVDRTLIETSAEHTILVRFRQGDWEEGPYGRAWLVEQFAKERDMRRTQQKFINQLSKKLDQIEARLSAIEGARR